MRGNLEARLRLVAMIGVCALLAASGPARAQFGAPFGVPGALTVPEAASGALGAGAAHSLQQQNCQQVLVGREGPKTVCTAPTPAPGAKQR